MGDRFPFKCVQCEQQPVKRFAIFQPANDWLIAYPEEHWLHIHLGGSVLNDDIGLAEAEFQYQWTMRLVEQYPNERFFYLIDMTRKDDREQMPPEAMQKLKAIIKHPQLTGGAAYGMTWGWHLFGKLLKAWGAKLSLEITREQADYRYHQWKSKQANTTN